MAGVPEAGAGLVGLPVGAGVVGPPATPLGEDAIGPLLPGVGGGIGFGGPVSSSW